MEKRSRFTAGTIGIALAASTLLFSGCEYDYAEPDLTPITTEVSFAADVVPIFNNSCNFSGCHSAGATLPDLTPNGAYESLLDNNMIDTENPANSELYKSMNSGSMKKYSTPEETKIIFAWIEQGALEN